MRCWTIRLVQDGGSGFPGKKDTWITHAHTQANYKIPKYCKELFFQSGQTIEIIN